MRLASVDRPESPDARLNSSTPGHDGPVWCPSRLSRIGGESWLQHLESARAWIEERRGRIPRLGTDDANRDSAILADCCRRQIRASHDHLEGVVDRDRLFDRVA